MTRSFFFFLSATSQENELKTKIKFHLLLTQKENICYHLFTTIFIIYKDPKGLWWWHLYACASRITSSIMQDGDYPLWTTEITYKPSRSFLLLHIACSCYISVYSRVSHITNWPTSTKVWELTVFVPKSRSFQLSQKLVMSGENMPLPTLGMNCEIK